LKVLIVRIVRKPRGGAIAETGPALLLLLVLVMFPLMDVLYMACAFGFSWFLHSAEIRELSVRAPKPAEAAANLTKVDTDFCNNSAGIAKFLGIDASTMGTKIQHPTVTFDPPSAVDPNGQVRLTTSVVIRPWLMIPFFMSVPGLNADMTFKFDSIKPQEENGKN
jgi:hypothetical protein